MRCKRCTGEEGEKCAFPADGQTSEFETDNCMCGTLCALREIIYRIGYGAAHVRSNDQTSAVLPLTRKSGCVAFTWYKDRGRVEAARVLYDDGNTEPLTLALAEELIEDYTS